MLHLIPFRNGHFLLESGHHGEAWLDLELLCLRPEPIERLAAAIAERLEKHRVEIICGPLIEGAFVGLLTALRLGVPFTYSERVADSQPGALYPYRYRIPRAQRDHLRGKRIAIVNDVINAGSAVGRTFEDLESCGANVVAIGALLVLGEWTARFVAEKRIALEALASQPNRYWSPEECPMCARGEPLTRAFE
ncbi:MAG: orotate phosphoribosyltransferase [Thermoanaerobaculia bacterium]